MGAEVLEVSEADVGQTDHDGDDQDHQREHGGGRHEAWYHGDTSELTSHDVRGLRTPSSKPGAHRALPLALKDLALDLEDVPVDLETLRTYLKTMRTYL